MDDDEAAAARARLLAVRQDGRALLANDVKDEILHRQFAFDVELSAGVFAAHENAIGEEDHVTYDDFTVSTRRLLLQQAVPDELAMVFDAFESTLEPFLQAVELAG